MDHLSDDSETFLKSPPDSRISNYHLDAEKIRPRVVSVEKFPRELSDGVVINPEASNFLSNDQRYIATEDFILDSVGLTIPQQANTSPDVSNILTPAIYGRAVATRLGRIPYANLMGEQIVFKGVGISGDHYPDEQSKDYVFNGYWTNQINPSGYVFQSDNSVDMEVSNKMLAEGARSSLNLGYIVVNENKFKRFVEDRWGKLDKSVSKAMISSIEQYQSQNSSDSRMIISARVGGTVQRTELLLNLMSNSFGGKEPDAYLKNLARGNIAHGARLMYEESINFPKSFSRYLNNIDISDAQSVLKMVSGYKQLKRQHTEVMTEIVTGMTKVDGDIIKKIGAKDENLLSLFMFYSAVKDIDFSFIHYDYDVVEPQIYQRERLSDVSTEARYLKTSVSSLGQYIWVMEQLINHDTLHDNLDKLYQHQENVENILLK